MTQGEALEAAGESMDHTITLLRQARALTEEGPWGRRTQIDGWVADAEQLQRKIYAGLWYQRRHT